ncbi:MAG: type IV toxin-antitoxin system AbiEi family antitoxin domain-containing protein [Chlamydiia bacterium]
MNKHLLNALLAWPRPYISGVALHSILDRSAGSRQAVLKRAIQEGYLVPIRRDLHLIQNLGKPLIDTFEIAPIVYGPSYVSFESALSYHGWIPEAVVTTTSASVKRSKDFDTPIGVFSYEHIPIESFSLAVEQHSRERCTLFIASPAKALADMIYTRKRTWASLDDVCQDLRIDPECFDDATTQTLTFLQENHPTARVRKSLSYITTPTQS